MFQLSTILFCYSAGSPISSDTKEALELRKIEINIAQNVINSDICEKTSDKLPSKSCSGEPGVFQDSARPNDPSLEKRTVIEDSRIDAATAAKPKESDDMKLNKKKNNLVQNFLCFAENYRLGRMGLIPPSEIVVQVKLYLMKINRKAEMRMSTAVRKQNQRYILQM